MMWMSGTASISFGSASSTAWLMACAPWLPPNTSSVGRASFGRGGTWKNSLPHRHAGHMAVAEVAAGRLEVHRRRTHHGRQHAIGEAGNHVRLEGDRGHAHHAPPPASPGPRHSRRRRSSRRDETRGSASPTAITARGRSSTVLSRVARSTRFSAPTWISRSSNPAAGTSRVSMPRCVPTNSTSASIARTQLLRDGQRRNDVAAGAASRHDHAHGLVRLAG